MSYTKQNFQKGNILYADQLNAMDEQISRNANTLESGNLLTTEHNTDSSAHADIRKEITDCIKKTDLGSAVDTALATAKNSGEFDGTSVSVSSVTESTESGGANVVRFSDGKTLTVKNGINGKNGDPYTLTETDMDEIAIKVIEHFGGSPVQCIITDENKIILSGVSVGTYTAYFQMDDGELIEGGVLTLSTETPLVTYTVTFVADGVTVATVEYTEGDDTLSNIPDVPTKAGYTGVWAEYTLNGNITVNAVYTKIPANTYTVTKNPTHCIISGNDTIPEGNAYNASVTAESGYKLSSVTVTMGVGVTDITESAYDGSGNINIASVTGNVIITAIAVEDIPDDPAQPTNFANPNDPTWKTGYRISSSAPDNEYSAVEEGFAILNIIGPVEAGDIIRVVNFDLIQQNSKVCMCKSATDVTPSGNGGINTKITGATLTAENVSATSTESTFTCKVEGYWRLSGKLTGTVDDVIVNIQRNGEWL